MHDVIIIGGSYAGMSAAIQIARARRRVAIIDAGRRRNRFAPFSHGFLGRDGVPPETIAAEARAQLLAYPSVTWIEGTAVSAEGEIDAFHVTLADGARVEGRRIVLATGVEDVLPEIPGLAAQWGTGAASCPYCHGYELDMGRVGVLATGPMSLHHALMLPDWGATTLFLNGAFEPDGQALAELARRKVTVERARVVAVDGVPGRPQMRLEDGREIAVAGLFVATKTRIAAALAQALGCPLEEGPTGRFIATDAMKAARAAGVFACGDAARAAGSVALAVGDGAMAGAAAHRSLIFPPQAARAA